MRSALEPLRVRAFRRLLISYLLNEIGDVVGLVALALLVYGETGDALATASLFLALNVAPAFLAPVLTARFDRMAVRTVLPGLYVLEAVVFVLLAAVAEEFALPVVLALGVVDGTLAVTGRSITRGAVGTLLLSGDLLRAGNGLLNVSFAVAGVGGAALGGVLTGSLGASSALLVDAGSFVAIALIIVTTAGLPAAHGAAERRVGGRLREGLHYVAAHPTVRMLVSGEALALVFFTLVVPIEVVYARETLETTEAGFGALLSSWSAGMVVGSLVFVIAKRRSLVSLVVASTGLVGVSYLGMAGVTGLLAACAFSVLGGVGNGIQWVSVLTAVQQDTPPDLHARVMGVLESLNRGIPAVGFLIGGILTALFSPPLAFVVAGTGVCLLAVGAGAFGASRIQGTVAEAERAAVASAPAVADNGQVTGAPAAARPLAESADPRSRDPARGR